RDEHRMIRGAAVREVELLLPPIELARAAALVRGLVREVVGDAREREQREDVLAQVRPREHRRHRIVVVPRADQRLAVAVTGTELQRRRQGHRERGGPEDAEAVDHGLSFTTGVPARRARTSRARSALTSPVAASSAATRSTRSPVAPAARARPRAWSAMWPRWMPSVASARSAARLVARPAAPASAARRFAVSAPASSSASRAPGWPWSAP